MLASIETHGESVKLISCPFLHFLLPTDEIASFCLQHRIRRLALFGSALRDDFRPDSDVDVLVEFAEGVRPGLIPELEKILATEGNSETSPSE